MPKIAYIRRNPEIRSRPDRFAGRGARHRLRLKLRQQCRELAFGVLVMLLDREAQRRFEQRLRFGAAAQLKEQFPEQDARHHPIGFFCHAGFEVGNGVRRAALADERLRQAEPEQLVVRLTFDERLKLGDARHEKIYDLGFTIYAGGDAPLGFPSPSGDGG